MRDWKYFPGQLVLGIVLIVSITFALGYKAALNHTEAPLEVSVLPVTLADLLERGRIVTAQPDPPV